MSALSRLLAQSSTKNKSSKPPATATTAQVAGMQDKLKSLLQNKKKESNDERVSNEDTSSTTSNVGNVHTTDVSTRGKLSTAIRNAVTNDSDGATTSLGKHEVSYEHLNTEQRQAVEMARAGHSFNLIGSAGTGKTTTVRTIATVLSEEDIIHKLMESTERVLNAGQPAIAVLSYTNQAVRNIKEALPQNFRPHCSTFHTLLEYYPQDIEVEEIGDDGYATGDYRNSRRFVPRYGMQPDGLGDGNLLPHLDYVVVEEGGSVPLDLWKTFLSALPNPSATTFIFLGDLNQLPPVFDDAILGFKLLELPIIELKEVYRNTGLVTKLAQRILSGKPLGDKEVEQWQLSDHSGSLTFKPFSKRHPADVSTMAIGTYFKKLVVAGEFDPQKDVVLIPYNKHFGTIELNKWIGQGLAERDNLEVHHVICGYFNNYFCVGDKVLHNKEYWLIDTIEKNPNYTGQAPLPPSTYMDRWGRVDSEHEQELLDQQTLDLGETDIDDLLDEAISMTTTKTSTQASARIILRNVEDPTRTTTVRSVGDVNGLLPVASMTVHKAQGSEWERVWLVLHHSHSGMVNRELVYTGVTRARRDLTLLYDKQNPLKAGDSMLQKGIINQKLKGQTLDSKLDYYRSKVKAEKLKLELAKKRATNQ